MFRRGISFKSAEIVINEIIYLNQELVQRKRAGSQAAKASGCNPLIPGFESLPLLFLIKTRRSSNGTEKNPYKEREKRIHRGS